MASSNAKSLRGRRINPDVSKEKKKKDVSNFEGQASNFDKDTTQVENEEFLTDEVQESLAYGIEDPVHEGRNSQEERSQINREEEYNNGNQETIFSENESDSTGNINSPQVEREEEYDNHHQQQNVPVKRRGRPPLKDEDYVGKRIAKNFPGIGVYEGTIFEYLHPLSEEDVKLWGVVYDDGDIEDYTIAQVKSTRTLFKKMHERTKTTTKKGTRKRGKPSGRPRVRSTTTGKRGRSTVRKKNTKKANRVEDLQENEFVVEKLTARRFMNGVEEYLVKWEGFTEDQSTWEPMDNLNCPSLLRLFHENIGKTQEAMVIGSDYEGKQSIV